MTLDEARALLGLERGASREEIGKAFRRRAREAHPDRHPGADERDRARHAREFDQVREARDILLLVAPHPGAHPTRDMPAGPTPTPAGKATPAASADSAGPPAGSRRAARAQRTQPRATDMPPRATLRFDEFVRQIDAEGFGPGVKSRPYHDVVRIVVWSVLAVAVAAVGGGVLLVTGA